MLLRPLTRFFTTSVRNIVALNSQFAIQSGAVCSAKLITETNSKLNSVELEMDEAEILRIPLVWLRDHCKSPSNFNWETNQRRSNATNLFEVAVLAENGMEFDQRNQVLNLRWSDGHHSVFHTKELLEWAIFTSKDYDDCASRTYWNRRTMREIPSVSSRNFDFTVFSRLFLRFGVVAVTGVDARNERATKKLCQEIAPIHETLHGDFWVFGNDIEEKVVGQHESMNYHGDLIGPHNDGTYLEQSLGVQVFHSLRLSETNNDVRLVDGFNAAQLLRQERPELFDILATTQIEHHYMEKTREEGAKSEEGDFFDEIPHDNINNGNKNNTSPLKLHARCLTKPVIECFKHKVVQVRFNPYDRAPLRTLRVVEFDEENARTNVEKTVLFYEAYERFSQIVHDQNSAFDLTLKPGTVIFIDNTRILHSFMAFKNLRRICGCYLSKDALLAKARPVLSSVFKNV